MRIFSVLPRPVSPLVDPPPGVYPQPRRSPQNARNAAGVHINPRQQEKRRRTPTERHTAYTSQNRTDTPQTEPQHRTRAAIQDYTLQQPGRSSRSQGSPNGDPQTAPQRAGTPPGCNGVAPQTEATHSGAQAAQRTTETPRAEARSVAPIYSFSTGQRELPAEKLKYKVKSSFHPLTEP